MRPVPAPAPDSVRQKPTPRDFDPIVESLRDGFASSIRSIVEGATGARVVVFTERPSFAGGPDGAVMLDAALRSSASLYGQTGAGLAAEWNCRVCHATIRELAPLVAVYRLPGGPAYSVNRLILDDPSKVQNSVYFHLARRWPKVALVPRGEPELWVSEDKTIGVHHAGGWSHIGITLPPELAGRGVVVGAGKAEAARVAFREAWKRTIPVLEELDRSPRRLAALRVACELLTTGALKGSKVDPMAVWLLEIAEHYVSDRERGSRNWALAYEIATAPEGFTHVRASILWALLDDLCGTARPFDVSAPFDMKAATAAWERRTSPLQYQRPQAAPKAGTIDTANRLFAELGLGPALARRNAVLSDVPAESRLWTPPPPEPRPARNAGVFDALRTPAVTAATVPPVTPGISTEITAVRFLRDVLPGAERITCGPLVTSQRHPFYALTAAVDPGAPPILAWDRPEARNTVSWYTYGSSRSGP